MMTIHLTRTNRQGKAVTGSIIIPLEQQSLRYTTLENADFLIPTGNYPLRLTWSPRFKKFMPLIDQVPERDGIRIHCGTKPEHSKGCVLVEPMALANLNVLFNQRKKWYDEEELSICITDDGANL